MTAGRRSASEPPGSPGNYAGVYLGVPGEVFPSGIAEFDGLNIPVEPGHYRLRFNTHTFEYAFDRIEDRG